MKLISVLSLTGSVISEAIRAGFALGNKGTILPAIACASALVSGIIGGGGYTFAILRQSIIVDETRNRAETR